MQKILTFIFILLMTTTFGVHAQSLTSKDKIIEINDLPEYVIISADNFSPPLVKSINIEINYRNSRFEKSLRDLEDILENKKYLRINNHTDILCVMSQLGYDYINAYSQNPGASSTFSRSSFVFRKKAKHRNDNN